MQDGVYLEHKDRLLNDFVLVLLAETAEEGRHLRCCCHLSKCEKKRRKFASKEGYSSPNN